MNQFWQRRDFSASTVKIYWILGSQLFSKALRVMGFAAMLSLKKKKNKTKQNTSVQALHCTGIFLKYSENSHVQSQWSDYLQMKPNIYLWISVLSLPVPFSTFYLLPTPRVSCRFFFYLPYLIISIFPLQDAYRDSLHFCWLSDKLISQWFPF